MLTNLNERLLTGGKYLVLSVVIWVITCRAQSLNGRPLLQAIHPTTAIPLPATFCDDPNRTADYVVIT